jgi:hypothetical protein
MSPSLKVTGVGSFRKRATLRLYIAQYNGNISDHSLLDAIKPKRGRENYAKC